MAYRFIQKYNILFGTRWLQRYSNTKLQLDIIYVVYYGNSGKNGGVSGSVHDHSGQ